MTAGFPPSPWPTCPWPNYHLITNLMSFPSFVLATHWWHPVWKHPSWVLECMCWGQSHVGALQCQCQLSLTARPLLRESLCWVTLEGPGYCLRCPCGLLSCCLSPKAQTNISPTLLMCTCHWSWESPHILSGLWGFCKDLNDTSAFGLTWCNIGTPSWCAFPTVKHRK